MEPPGVSSAADRRAGRYLPACGAMSQPLPGGGDERCAAVGGAGVDAFLVVYGRGMASFLLGPFIVATAASMPFTAQFARAPVPPSDWLSPVFLQINRRLSLAWGVVILVVGASHVVGAILAAQGQARWFTCSSTGVCRSSRSCG